MKLVTSVELLDVPETDVFDLGVQDNHNYFVYPPDSDVGALVHNCHYGASTEFAKVLLGLNARHPIGLTGTDDRKDGLYCQPAGTLVSTPSGSKLIESFSIGDEVHSFNHEDNSVVTRNVTNLVQRPPEDLYEVIHETGTIRCTGDHRLWSVTRNAYVKVKDLKDSDILITLQN